MILSLSVTGLYSVPIAKSFRFIVPSVVGQKLKNMAQKLNFLINPPKLVHTCPLSFPLEDLISLDIPVSEEYAGMLIVRVLRSPSGCVEQ